MFVAHTMNFYTDVAVLNMLTMKWLSFLIHRLGLSKVYGQPSFYHAWVILNANGFELEYCDSELVCHKV